MNTRFIALASVAALGSALMAAPLTFASGSFGNNATVRMNWMTATGITAPDHSAIFDNLADGNIHGVANVYPGLTITSTNSSAIVTSNASLLGSSNPIGLKAVALTENSVQTVTFATPIDYFSLISIDASSVAITVNYVGGGSSVHSNGSSSSSGNTGVFFGLYRNDQPQITSLILNGDGGDGEWGLDNVEYGVVPEPGTMLVLGLGAVAAVAKRRRRA